MTAMNTHYVTQDEVEAIVLEELGPSAWCFHSGGWCVDIRQSCDSAAMLRVTQRVSMLGAGIVFRMKCPCSKRVERVCQECGTRYAGDYEGPLPTR